MKNLISNGNRVTGNGDFLFRVTRYALLYSCLAFATASWAATPTVTSINPVTVEAGQITVITVEGTNFVTGATATFEFGGVTDARTNSTTSSAEVKSATQLELFVNIDPSALTGQNRHLTVTNPGDESGALLSALQVDANSGSTKIPTEEAKFATPTGFVTYESDLIISASKLYLSARISSEAGVSPGKINARLLIDHKVFTGVQGSYFSQEAGVTTEGTYYCTAEYAAGFSGDHIITVYAENDSGSPAQRDFSVTVTAAPSPTALSVAPVYSNLVHDPSSSDPMIVQFPVPTTITKPLTMVVSGSSPVIVRRLDMSRVRASQGAGDTGPGYHEEPLDGKADDGTELRSGVYLVTIHDGDQIIAQGKIYIHNTEK